jgi:hypothetical protein
MQKYFPIYEEAVRLYNSSTLNFLIYEENLIFFFSSVTEPIKAGARSARARTRGQNALVLEISLIYNSIEKVICLYEGDGSKVRVYIYTLFLFFCFFRLLATAEHCKLMCTQSVRCF